jgi:hypothetical protein
MSDPQRTLCWEEQFDVYPKVMGRQVVTGWLWCEEGEKDEGSWREDIQPRPWQWLRETYTFIRLS